MTKPTEELLWASGETAVKEETTAKQKTHGWTTSDDTVNGTAQRPVLENQNWWQDQVGSLVKFAGDSLPDDAAAVQVVDLWEWDTANLGQLDTQLSGQLPFIDDIEVSSGDLLFTRDNSTPPVNGDPWLDFQPETQYGGMFYEFQDMLDRGIGIRLVDGNDVIWTVFNANGTGLADFSIPTNLASIPEGLIKSGVGNDLNFTIQSSSTDVSIEKIDAGVTTFPSDFTGFVALDISNFATKNPNGIRAVLYGQQATEITTGGISSAKTPKRRWIRPALTSNSNKDSSPALQWPIAWEPGKRYSLHFLLAMDSSATPVDSEGVIYAEPTALTPIHGYTTTALMDVIMIKCEFTGPFGTTRKGISFSSTNLMNDNNEDGNMDDMYPGIQLSNVLTLEEIE